MHTANDMLKATMRESLKHANVNWIKSKIKPRTHKKNNRIEEGKRKNQGEKKKTTLINSITLKNI